MTSNLVRYAGIVATAVACAAMTACGHATDGRTVSRAGPTASTPGYPPPATVDGTAPASSPQASDPTVSPTDHLVAQPATRACRVSDLALSPIVGDGAAGHVYYGIIVTNTSGRPCRLPAGHPVFVATNAATGARGVVPTRPNSSGPALAVTIDPGARAETVLGLVNGYGGYDPSHPACAHPAVYRDVAVRLSSGLLPLTGLVLDVKCDGVTAYDWTTPPWTQANPTA